MRKRNIALIFGIIAIIAILSSGTVAYFTANGSATNVITSGSVDVKIKELSSDEDGKVSPFKDVVDVVPGKVISKIVTVENKGKTESYVRVKVNSVVTFEDGTEKNMNDSDSIAIDFDTKNWTKSNDGYWYYNGTLKGGEETKPLFTEVKFSEAMGNEFKKATLVVGVDIQATQAKNNGTSAFDAEYPEGGESK